MLPVLVFVVAAVVTVDKHFSLMIRAVNTSSSSISESELGAFDADGAGANFPVARRFVSNSSSWPMKLRFGEMMGRANFTIL